MKFGIFQLVPGGHGRDDRQVLLNNLEQIRLAEELGFHSAWVAEHHFSPYGLVNDPMLYLAAAAVQTSRIRLGAGVMVVPLHNPVRFAENVAWVDTLSNGRLDVGVGRGYQPHEFVGFDVPMEESQERTDETLEFLKRAWSEETVDFDGQYFNARGISLLPRCVQKPHPPVMMAAVSPSTFERMGVIGERILTSPNFTPVEMIRENFAKYREALSTNGFDPAAYDYPLMQQVYVGGDAERGYSEPQLAAMQYYSLLGRLLPQPPAREGDGTIDGGESYDFYGKVQKRVGDLEYDFLFENGVTFGDSERVVERIRRLRDEVGITYFQGWFNFGSLDHDLAMESMRRFATEVMPSFEVETARAAS